MKMCFFSFVFLRSNCFFAKVWGDFGGMFGFLLFVF